MYGEILTFDLDMPDTPLLGPEREFGLDKNSIVLILHTEEAGPGRIGRSVPKAPRTYTIGALDMHVTLQLGLSTT